MQEIMTLIKRDKVQATICRNLIKAGVLLPVEVDRYTGVLATYHEITLLKVLITSHELREYSEGG